MSRIQQDQAAQLMRADVRRCVYEGGDSRGKPSGRYYVDYSDGKSPELVRADVDQMVRDGVLLADTECPGFFKRGPRL